jgi:hypothetical protein
MAKSNPAAGDAQDASADLVTLHHNSALACSHDGYSYEADGNGNVVVPAAAVEALAAHGFAIVPRPPAANPTES